MVTQELQSLCKQVQRFSTLTGDLQELKVQRSAAKKEVKQLLITANNEKFEVEELEGFTLKGIMSSFSGKKEEMLEKERREASHAQSAYNFAAVRLQMLEDQIKSVEAELSSLDGVVETYMQHLLGVASSLPESQLDTLLQHVKECVDGREQIRRATEIWNSLEALRIELRNELDITDALISRKNTFLTMSAKDKQFSKTETLFCQLWDSAAEYNRLVPEEQSIDMTPFRELGRNALHECFFDLSMYNVTGKMSIIMNGMMTVSPRLVKQLENIYVERTQLLCEALFALHNAIN